MSVEQAKAFIEKMKTDEAFREQIMAIETPEERLKAIGAAGFECTGEEINESAGTVDVSGGFLADLFKRGETLLGPMPRIMQDLVNSMFHNVERLTTPR